MSIEEIAAGYNDLAGVDKAERFDKAVAQAGYPG